MTTLSVVLADLAGRPARSILTAAGIAVGVGACGALGGSLLAFGAVRVIETAPVVAGLIHGQFAIQLFVVAWLAALAAGILGGAYPAWRACSLDPADALRAE